MCLAQATKDICSQDAPWALKTIGCHYSNYNVYPFIQMCSMTSYGKGQIYYHNNNESVCCRLRSNVSSCKVRRLKQLNMNSFLIQQREKRREGRLAWITSSEQMFNKCCFPCGILTQKHHHGLGVKITVCLPRTAHHKI